MKGKGIYRGDIYFADLSSVNMENHPVVVISSWKINSKKDRITVALLSSKTNKCIENNVLLNNSCLVKDSKITVDTVYTIEKSKLIYKIGSLETKEILELDNKLRNSLELQEKSYNLNYNDLENLFIENINNLNDEDKTRLQDFKIRLWNNYQSGNYQKAIIIAEELALEAINCRLINKTEYIYYAYYMGALCLIKIKNFKSALIFAKKSLTCLGNPNELNYSYANSMWEIARCYEELNFTEKAVEIYKVLIKYYKQHNDVNMEFACKFNLAKLQKNLEKMIEVKNDLEKINFDHEEKFFNKKNFKGQFLKEMNEEIKKF